jgi:transcriptional regulator with XRE-family HTH domain
MDGNILFKSRLSIANISVTPKKSIPVSKELLGSRAQQARALSEIARVRSGRERAEATTLAAEMSALLGEKVGDRDVGKWLRGESMPGTVERLWAFAHVLGVDPGWLYFGEASDAPPPPGGTAAAVTKRSRGPAAPDEERPQRKRSGG